MKPEIKFNFRSIETETREKWKERKNFKATERSIKGSKIAIIEHMKEVGILTCKLPTFLMASQVSNFACSRWNEKEGEQRNGKSVNSEHSFRSNFGFDRNLNLNQKFISIFMLWQWHPTYRVYLLKSQNAFYVVYLSTPHISSHSFHSWSLEKFNIIKCSTHNKEKCAWRVILSDFVCSFVRSFVHFQVFNFITQRTENYFNLLRYFRL